MEEKTVKKNETARRVALYARVSSQAQADDDRVSLQEQTSEMEKYCTGKGYSIVARYQDIAPGSTRKRPSFLQMLEDAKAGRFDIILCWKSDRLSRGIFPAAAIMEVIEVTGVRLEAVVDHIDEKTFGIFAAIGKIEIDNFRERATIGKRGAAKNGKWPVGNVPYGYRTDDDRRPVINPEEALFVRDVFRLYVEEGMGSQRIADWLTEQNAPRRRGSSWGSWFPQQVLTMLSYPAYKGEGVYGRKRYRTTESGLQVSDQDASEQIKVPFPPLVSEEVWDQAQQIKRSRRTMSSRNTKAIHLLQGVLVCDECGFRFSVITQKGNTQRTSTGTRRNVYKNPIRYYKCGGMLRHGLKCREHSHVRADGLESVVWTELVKILESPELVVNGLMPGVEGPDRDQLDKYLSQAESDLRKIESEEDRLIRLLVSAKITEAQFDRQRKFITERLEAAKQAVDAARGRLQATESVSDIEDAVKIWTSRLKQGIDSLTELERQKLVRLMLHRVKIDRAGSITLVLTIPVGDLIAFEKRDS